MIPLCCLPLYIFQIQVQVASFKFWRMSLFTSLRHPPIWILFCKSWSFNLDILSWDERNNFPLSLQFRSLPNMFSPFSNLIGILEIIAFSSLWSSIGRHILLQSSFPVWWHSNTEKTLMPESQIHWTKLEISVPGTAQPLLRHSHFQCHCTTPRFCTTPRRPHSGFHVTAGTSRMRFWASFTF